MRKTKPNHDSLFAWDSSGDQGVWGKWLGRLTSLSDTQTSSLEEKNMSVVNKKK